ncbi:hypothetical protein E2562_035215 [Oryza meyeriana var. granulata]|uniref:Uncharacterized protein n=1 Tax=Oryza meyeriana var. granulata TaxID=110450 RepID=A0A6G1DRL5_9ORYZ|nr:hypothetical protein E2562_035215 [Oryza meyeriana var. granulata]
MADPAAASRGLRWGAGGRIGPPAAELGHGVQAVDPKAELRHRGHRLHRCTSSQPPSMVDLGTSSSTADPGMSSRPRRRRGKLIHDGCELVHYYC